MIEAELSSKKKWRNKQEYRSITTASAEGITIESDGMLMPKLAQALIDAGKPADCLLSAYRGTTLCLKPNTLKEWASGSVGKGEQPEQLKRNKA